MKGYVEYKNTTYDWLPSVPAHWHQTTIRSLMQLSDIRCGARSDLELLSVYREYGVIKKDSRDDNHNKASLDISNYKYVGKNFVVMNKMKMWQGSLGISAFEGIVSPAYIVCTVRKDLNFRYLNYLLRSHPFKIFYNRISYGIRVGQWDLRYDDLKTLSLFLPPREEQDQIVRYLDAKVGKINKLIRIKQKQIALLKEYIYSELDALILCSTKTISIKRLVFLESNFIEVEKGKLYSKIGMYNRGRGIFSRPPVLGKDMGISKFQKVSEDMLLLSGQFAWEGSVSITQKKDEKSVASHRYYLLSVKDSSVTIEYIWSYLTSRDGIELLNRCSHGAAGRNKPLNIKELLRANIPIPPLENHGKLKHLVCRLESFVEQINSVIITLAEYRTRLISDVVTGKVDVRGLPVLDFNYAEFGSIEHLMSDEDASRENDMEIGDE